MVAIIVASGPLGQRAGREPRFNEHPVTKIYHGKTASVPVSYSRFPATKTGVWDAAKKKPNFAGRYILAVGSCGGRCRTVSLIDARTGRVYNFRHTLVASFSNKSAIGYRLNSKLIILRGWCDEKQEDDGTHYYKFERGRFVHLRSIFRQGRTRD
jgi:hypothetical protein